MSTPRREFLASSAAAATSLLAAPSSAAPLLKTVPLGPHQVTRLIVGANPFYGYSHFNKLFDLHMREWCTTERVCQVLQQCAQNGINTWQFHYCERSGIDMARHRATGGTLQWITLSDDSLAADRAKLIALARQKPLGIVHHGGITDTCFRSGKMPKVQEFLKAVRDTGVLVGMSTHTPEVIEYVEERNWDIDFYMTALYCVTRPVEEMRKMLGHVPLGEPYLEDDPLRMFKVIRQTRKTCLAFKILAAGRRCNSPQQVEKTFQFVFDSIKAKDAVIVGMYPRYQDQVAENAALVRRLA